MPEKHAGLGRSCRLLSSDLFHLFSFDAMNRKEHDKKYRQNELYKERERLRKKSLEYKEKAKIRNANLYKTKAYKEKSKARSSKRTEAITDAYLAHSREMSVNELREYPMPVIEALKSHLSLKRALKKLAKATNENKTNENE